MLRNHSILLFGLLIVAPRVSLSSGSNLNVLSQVYHIFKLIDGINIGKTYSKELETIIKKNNLIITAVDIAEELRNVFKRIPELGPMSAIKLKSIITTLIEQSEITGRLGLLIDRLLKRLHSIDNYYARFSRIYLEANNTIVEIVENFSMMITSENIFGLNHKLQKIHQLIYGSNRKKIKLFGLISRQMQHVKLHYCDHRGLSQQHIYNLFDNIVLREMKAYIMMSTAHVHLQTHQKSDYMDEMRVITANTERRLFDYVHEVRKVIIQMPTDVLQCGPVARNRSDFIELKGSFQGIVIDDAPSNIRCVSGESYACVSPKKVPMKFAMGNDVCIYQNENQCLGQSCYDEMSDCESIAEQVVVCDANPDSHRRYDYVRSGHEKVHRETDVYYRNKTDHCYQAPKQGFATYIRAGYTIYSCYFCMCTCMGNGWKATDLRAISFLEQKAEISELKAIIGIRFIEENGMVHLQIKQGTVLSGGQIQEGSGEWKPIEKIERKFSPGNPEIPPEYYYMHADGETKLIEHLEYCHISKDFRKMSLNDVKIPKGYLITGIKLQFEKKLMTSCHAVIGDSIELQITATPFHFKSGIYTESENNPSIYVTSSMYRNASVERRKIEFESPDVPIDGPEDRVDHGSDQIVEFRVTDYKKDAGQTIIPFFDARAVEAIPNMPLSGIGLYFKGSSGYGGFIAPKIFILDAQNYFNVSIKLSAKYQITMIN